MQKLGGDKVFNKRYGVLARMIGIIAMITISIMTVGCFKHKDSSNGKMDSYRTVAYVTVPASENWRWIGSDGDKVISEVDTRYVTHIHFAFGMLEAYQFQDDTTKEPLKEGRIVSKEAYRNPQDGKYHYKVTLQGWIEEMKKTVDGRKYLEALVDLKRKKPELKVILSIGGWDSDGFCYMAKTSEGRQEFAQSCASIIKEYNLDGIDVDWEYPTNGGWQEIASCDACVKDARELLKDIRKVLEDEFPNEHKSLSIASGASQSWVDNETFKVLDYMDVMCYDFNPGSGGSQADLETAKMFIQQHTQMVGDSPENRKKILFGIPFYNEGGPYLVPYYKEWDGHVDTNPKIIAKKMNWIKEKGYGGAFYWAYSMDVFEKDVKSKEDSKIKILQKTVYETLNDVKASGKTLAKH